MASTHDVGQSISSSERTQLSTRNAGGAFRHGLISAFALCAVTLMVVAFAAGALVSTYVFDRLPHVEDEVTFIFQAKIFATARLVAPAPALSDFFYISHILVRDGMWFGKYPPGFSVLLLPGVLVDQVWLANPVFAALTVGLACAVGRRLYSSGVGVLAGALLLISPFFLLHAGSEMSHVASLLLTMTFVALFARNRSRPTAVSLLAQGAAFGLLFLTRPLTAVGIALPFALWSILDVVVARRRLLTYTLVLVATVPFVGAFLGWNLLTTGDPFKTGYELFWEWDKVGFGPGYGPWGGHTPEAGLESMQLQVGLLADYLYGWPERLSAVPAVFAVIVAVARLCRTAIARFGVRPASRAAGVSSAQWDLALAGLVVGLIAVHIAYWCPCTLYGPRYYFESLGALALLSARGIVHLTTACQILMRFILLRGPYVSALAPATVALAVVLLTGNALLNFDRDDFANATHFNNIDRIGLDQVRGAGLSDAIVFVTSGQQPDYAWPDYASFFMENSPLLDTSVIFAEDLGGDRDWEFIHAYPGRVAYRFSRNDSLQPFEDAGASRH